MEMEWPDPINGKRTVRRYFRKDAVDKVQQIFFFTFFLRTYEGDNMVHEDATAMSLSYYTYPHLRALFLLAGLEIVEEYGTFDKTPLDNSATQMIFLLRRGKSSLS